MVYINKDGTLYKSPPWNLDRLTKIFFGIITFVIYFFKTLVGLDTSDSKTSSWRGSSGTSYRGSGGGGGGGGGRPFGPGGGGGGGGGPRIRTMRDINPPTVRGVGGCPGGSCGL